MIWHSDRSALNHRIFCLPLNCVERAVLWTIWKVINYCYLKFEIFQRAFPPQFVICRNSWVISSRRHNCTKEQFSNLPNFLFPLFICWFWKIYVIENYHFVKDMLRGKVGLSVFPFSWILVLNSQIFNIFLGPLHLCKTTLRKKDSYVILFFVNVSLPSIKEGAEIVLDPLIILTKLWSVKSWGLRS